MNDSVIRLVLLLVGLLLAVVIIGQLARGVIRLVLLGVLVALSLVGFRWGLAPFFQNGAGLVERSLADSAPASTSPTTQATPNTGDVSEGKTGFQQVPQFVQPLTGSTNAQRFGQPARAQSFQAQSATGQSPGYNSASGAGQSQAPVQSQSVSQPIRGGW